MSQICYKLRSNLCEITAAVQVFNKEDRQQPNLVAVAEDQVVYTKNICARIKIFILKILKWLRIKKNDHDLGKSLKHNLHNVFDQVISQALDYKYTLVADRVRQIKKVTENGNELFKKNCQRYFEADLPLYGQYFDRFYLIFNKTIHEKPCSRQIKRLFLDNVESVYPFWKKYIFFHDLFLDSLGAGKNLGEGDGYNLNDTINDYTVYKSLLKEINWIDFESALKQKVPINELIKLGNKEVLSYQENSNLNRWIKGVNRLIEVPVSRSFDLNKISCKVQEVLLQFMALVELEGSNKFTIIDLIIELYARNCRLDRLVDEHCLRWRNSLKPGMKINYHGGVIQLGDELIYESKSGYIDKAKMRYFKIKNLPDSLLVTAANLFALAIDYNEKKHYQAIIPAAEVYELVETESGSSFMLMRGYNLSFKDFHWKSNSPKLMKEDLKFARPLASVAVCLINWGIWPNKDIDVDKLFYTEKNQLITMDQICCDQAKYDVDPSGNKNFLRYEKFIIDLSKGNIFLTSYFAQVTGLLDHVMASFFQKIGHQVFQTGELNLFDVCYPIGCNTDEYKDKVKELTGQCLELRQLTIDNYQTLLEDELNLDNLAETQVKINSIIDEIVYFKDRVEGLRIKFRQFIACYQKQTKSTCEDSLIRGLSATELVENQQSEYLNFFSELSSLIAIDNLLYIYDNMKIFASFNEKVMKSFLCDFSKQKMPWKTASHQYADEKKFLIDQNISTLQHF